MLDYVYGHDEIIAPFVAERISRVSARGFGKCATVGIVQGTDLIAGLVYHDYNPEAGVIQLSAAALPGKQWLTRETLKRMFQYPFLQLGCQMLVQIGPIANEHLLRQLAALNYSLIRIPRLLGRETDAVVCLLTREDWESSKVCQRFKHHIPDEQLREAA